ncbi:hypothetical protein PAMP_020365 [Pampus punctatissimus]
MRTKVIRLVALFMLIILLPVSSADTVTQNNTDPVTTFNNTATSTEAPYHSFSTDTQATMATKEDVMQQNDTTPTSPMQHTPVSYSSTCQHDLFTSSASTTNPETSKIKLILFLTLLGIMVLLVFIGCIHTKRQQLSTQDSSAPRLLVSMRERLRVGLHLWSGEKIGGEDQEEAEGRQGDTEEGGSSGVRNEVKVEQKEELSDSSDDYSSMEGDNLRERALSRWEEEQKKQSRNDDAEETSSASEEIALVNSRKEDDEKADLTDVTIL